MKLKRLLLVLAISGVIHLQAQVESPNSIGLGIGILTAPDFVDYAEPKFSLIENSLITKGTTTSIPAFMLEYNRALGMHVDLGFSIVYQQFKTTYNDIIFGSNLGTATNHFLSIMPQIRIHYIPVDSWLGLYSGAAIGVHYQVIDARDFDFDVESSGTVGLSWQVTAIGAEVGNKFGAHAELGFGFKGIISAGVHARF